MNEYNVKCHYTTKHYFQFDEILGQAQVDKIEQLRKSTTSYKKDSEMVTKLRFRLCESGRKGKAFW